MVADATAWILKEGTTKVLIQANKCLLWGYLVYMCICGLNRQSYFGDPQCVARLTNLTKAHSNGLLSNTFLRAYTEAIDKETSGVCVCENL